MRLVVARVGRAHGIRGEVTVEVRTDAPGERFVNGKREAIGGVGIEAVGLADGHQEAGGRPGHRSSCEEGAGQRGRRLSSRLAFPT